MLKAFFDDSGTSPSNRIAAVAGYIASAYHWERFNSKWKELLREYQVRLMRRSDLENLKGQYSGWDKNRQIEFLRRSHSIIKTNTSVGIGASVYKGDFEKVMPRDLKDTLGGVYGWCVHDCLTKLEYWCDRENYRGFVFYVFEAGTEGQAQIDFAMRLFFSMSEYKKRFRIQGWTFQNKTVIPLQAADVLAYEVYKAGESYMLKGRNRQLRRSAEDLIRQRDFRYVSSEPWAVSHLMKWLNEWTKHHPELATRALSAELLNC